jgi:hypothetical protein
MPASVDAGGCLAWCPLPGSHDHPMGLVMALRGSGSRHLYMYDPTADAWSYLENALPRGAKGGAAIAAGPSGADVFMWPGGGETDFYWYVYPNQGVAYRQTSPLRQEPGAALCQVGGICYGVFGDGNGREFWRYSPGPEPSGEQSSSGAGLPQFAATVQQRKREHRFAASGVIGLVELRVLDATGRVVARDEQRATAGHVTLTWRHVGIPAGVYLYTLTNGPVTRAGRVTAIR